MSSHVYTFTPPTPYIYIHHKISHSTVTQYLPGCCAAAGGGPGGGTYPCC